VTAIAPASVCTTCVMRPATPATCARLLDERRRIHTAAELVGAEDLERASPPSSDPAHVELAQYAARARDRRVARGVVHDDLRDQRVVVRRNDRSVSTNVSDPDAGAERRAEALEPAREGVKPRAGSLRVDADLDRVARRAWHGP